MAGLDQNLVDLLRGAPELQQNPGLALGMAQGVTASANPLAGQTPDAYGVGQATSYALGTQGHDQALSEVQQNNTTGGTVQPSAAPGSKHRGFWGSIGHFFGHDLIHPVAQAMNAGLQDVQHTYRFTHDVWERHGVIPAVGTMAAMALGAAAGAFIGRSPEAGILGAEGAGDLYGRLGGYQDSWKATADGATYRDIHNGEIVSPGRDLANLVDHLVHGRNYQPGNVQVVNGIEQPEKGKIDTVTGLVNGAFDLTLDPLMRIGKLQKAIRTQGVVRDGERGIQVGSRRILVGSTPRPLVQPDGTAGSDVYTIWENNPGVQDAFKRIAGMDTQQVLRTYGQRFAPLAKALGAASSDHEVAQVFDQAITARNYSFIRYGLPTTTLTRRALDKTGLRLPTLNQVSSGIQDMFSKPAVGAEVTAEKDGVKTTFWAPGKTTDQVLSNAQRNLDDGVKINKVGNVGVLHSSVTDAPVMIPWGPGRVINAFTSYQPFAFNSKTLELSGKEGDPSDPEFMRGLYSVLRHSQNAATSQAILARYAEADSLGERINIITNAYRDAMRASGLPDTDPFSIKATGDVNYLVKQSLRRVYGVGTDGKPLSIVDGSGNLMNRGIWTTQKGNIAFPNFSDWRTAMADAKGGIWKPMVHADDWINAHYTRKFFKRLILLSLGFALRVSAGEAIPAMLSFDGKRYLGSALAAASAKLNPDMGELFRDLPDAAAAPEERALALRQHPLIGKRASVPGRTEIGVMKDFDTENGQAILKFPGETSTTPVPWEDVTLYHDDIADEEVARIAKEYGLQVSKDEIPHIRAALGKALYGVSRALVDRDYRDVALMNLLANDGHLVAPGLASDHDMPRGFGGINEDVRNAVYRTGLMAKGSLDKKMMGDSWSVFDSEDPAHPMHWNAALSEAALDPGARRAAKAFHEAYTGSGPVNVLEHDIHPANALPQGGQLVSRTPEVQTIQLSDMERNIYATNKAIEADLEFLRSDHPDAVEIRADMAHAQRSLEDYAAVRTEALKGLVFGRNGKLNEDVLQNLAQGRSTSIGNLASREYGLRPLAVKGRTLDDMPRIGGIEKVANIGWRAFIHPTINSLSRAPIYTMLVTDEYKFFKPWMDAGLMSKNEAHAIAQVRALNRMLPLIHNTLLRNQFALTVRNIAPFYFAQEQAYKRYGRVIFSDPAAFREGQLLYHGLVSTGALQQDPSGNKYIVFPGHGDLSWLATLAFSHMGINTLSGVPGTISGDTISLRSVVPEMNQPSVSPLVAVPLKEIAKHFPKTDPFVHSALGDVSYNSTMADEVIPNLTLRRAWEAMGNEHQSLAFASAFNQNAAYAAHKALLLWQQAEKIDPNAMQPNFPRNQLKPEAAALLAQADAYVPLPGADPNTAKQAVDRLRNTTRIQLLMKTLVGAVSPLSPVMKVGDVKLENEFANDIKQYGITKGIQVYTDKHPDATPYTVFSSDNSATGTSPPSTKTALDWLDQNREWADRNQMAAAYLVPQQPGKFDSQAYNQELAMGLRQRRTGQDFLNAIYLAEGNAEYIPSLKDYEKALSETTDSYQKQSLRASWQNYLSDLQHRNPVWYDQQFDPAKVTTAQRAYEELVNASNDPHAPDSPMMPVVRELIASFQDYQRAKGLAQAGQLSMTQSQLTQSWYDYLDSVVAKTPEAQAVAYGVFRRLVKGA